MRELPILFSGAMARAVLDDRKTQTRRTVTGTALDWLQPGMFTPEYTASPDSMLSPYGLAGDRLWGREAWRTTGDDGRADDIPPRDLQPHPVWYEADGIAPANQCVGKYRPSMFMPRWASRITLEHTAVRIERLQDIREEDAHAEGIYLFPSDGGGYKWARGEQEYDSAVETYRHLWDSLNAARGFGWDTNPWVWVVEFALVRK